MTPPVRSCEGGCGAMPGERCRCVGGVDRETGRRRLDGRRLCACGCGGRIDSSATRRLSLEGHRQRAYERRLEEAARRSGRPARLRLKDVDAAKGTGERHADAQNGARAAQKRRPRPGVSVYLPRPALLVDLAVILETVAELEGGDPDLASSELAAIAARALERAKSRGIDVRAAA